MLAVVSPDRLEAFQFVEGGLNMEWLHSFLEDFLLGVKDKENLSKNNKANPKVLLLLDNASCHKTNIIKSWAA